MGTKKDRGNLQASHTVPNAVGSKRVSDPIVDGKLSLTLCLRSREREGEKDREIERAERILQSEGEVRSVCVDPMTLQLVAQARL